MIRLDTTTRKLQAVLSGAVTTNQLPITSCYSDQTTTTYLGGSSLVNTNSTTAVDVVAAPAASTVRDIDYISVYNADTVGATISFLYDDNSTDYNIITVTLDVGDKLEYVHGSGWKTTTSEGKIKVPVGTGGGTSLPVADTTAIVMGSADNSKQLRFEIDGFTTATTRVLTPPDSDAIIVGTVTSQTLTNKTIDADSNTITNIENADIKAGAAIDASKIADGTVSSTEFQYLGNVTSDIQSQINGKQASDATLTALAAYNTNGLLTQTAADTFTGRTVTGTADRISVTNGDGVLGNPTLDVASTYAGQNTIVTVGTIGTGTWQGTAIASGYGGTGFTTYATGDIIYASGVNTLAKLTAGTDGYVLTLASGVPTWAAGGGTSSLQIQPIAASVGSNALTITLNPTTLDFRDVTLGSGTVNTRTVASAISVVVSSGSTLGTVNAVQNRLAVLAIDNAGTVELAVVNLAGGVNLDETGVISTTAEGGAGAADSATVIYSTTARSNVPYRVVGFVESTQATAGTWATAPSLIQGYGGQAFAAMSSLGYGQTWQDLTASRAKATTYYNTTGKPILVNASGGTSTANRVLIITINGEAVYGSSSGSANHQVSVLGLVPPGGSYSIDSPSSTWTMTTWKELR